MKGTGAILIFLLGALPGCMVGPNYRRPSALLPVAYSERRDAGQKDTFESLACWWTFFNDPCLNDLIERAVEHNYDLSIAIEKIEQLRAEYGIAKSRLFPEVDGIININRTKYSKNLAQYSFLTVDTLSYFQLGLQAMWEVDLFGRLRRAFNAACDDVKAQVELMHGVYLLVLSNVAQAYTDIRALEKQIDLRQQLIQVDEKIILLKRDRFQSGLDSDIPVEQFLQELEESKNLYEALKTSVAQALHTLAFLLGEYPEQFKLCPAEAQVSKPGPPTVGILVSSQPLEVGLPSELLKRRPDIRQAEWELAAATERVGQAMADYFPRFSLLGSVTSEASTASTWFSPGSLAWIIGPSIQWPLITFGRITYRVDEKKSIMRQALLTYCQTIVAALRDVENALVAYFNDSQRSGILSRKLAAAIKERDLAKERFNSGLDDQITYLLAERNRLQIELELTDVQRAVSSDLIAVYKALGGGW